MSQISEPPAEIAAQEEKQARRSLWRGLILPFLFVLLIVGLFVGSALSLPAPLQVALLSDSLLTVLVLLPLTLCMLPLLILSLALVLLMRRWQARSRSPLRRLEAWTAMLAGNAERWLGQVDKRVLEWLVRLAPILALLKAFDPPSEPPAERENEYVAN